MGRPWSAAAPPPAFVALLASLALLASAAAALEPSDVPRPRTGQALVDLAGVVGAADAQAIAAAAESAGRASGGRLVVVAIRSTGGAPHRDFATRLFNAWQLGDATRDDGILVFAAIDDRRVEIILGDGIDSEREDAISQRIVDVDMKPRFRAGDPGAALAAGARACAHDLLGATAEAPTVPAAGSVPVGPPSGAAGPAEAPFAPAQPSPPARVEAAPTRHVPFIPVDWEPSPPASLDLGGDYASTFVVGGLLSAIVAGFGLRGWLRHRSRGCAACGTRMVRLDEVADDQRLTAAERTEERIGSVDYDVWACPGCDAVVKLRFGAWFTRYSRCPACDARTRHSRSTTLRSATYDAGGIVEIDVSCANCSYAESYRRSTPRLKRSTDSSFSSSSGSGSSFSGDSGSSSSSSSGGGHSSGGGGGGSW